MVQTGILGLKKLTGNFVTFVKNKRASNYRQFWTWVVFSSVYFAAMCPFV